MGDQLVFELHLDCVARPGAVIALRVVDRDVEVVKAADGAGNGLAGRERDGDFLRVAAAPAPAGARTASAGPYEARLELLGRVAAADFSQVAGRRMAVLAAARTIEIGLSGFSVAGDYVETRVKAAIGHK